MSKKTKKLTLNKQTILSPTQLDDVSGGTLTTYSKPSGCPTNCKAGGSAGPAVSCHCPPTQNLCIGI